MHRQVSAHQDLLVQEEYMTLQHRVNVLLFLLSPFRLVVFLKKCIVELVSKLCKVCLQSHAKLLTNLLTKVYAVHKLD